MKRLAAIGDVHGNSLLLARAIEAARNSGAETIVCVGDVAGHPENTDRCCDLLKSNNVVTVRGNHDRWFLEAARTEPAIASSVRATTLEYLASLPPIAHFGTLIGLGMVCHGVGKNDLGHFPVTFLESFLRRERRLGRVPRECRMIIHGHSHRHEVRTCDDVTIISVGPLRDDGSMGCVVIQPADRTVEPLSY